MEADLFSTAGSGEKAVLGALKGGSKTAKQLMAELKMSRPQLYHHLGQLYDADKIATNYTTKFWLKGGDGKGVIND
jgi:predicted transcriptional regulator